MTALLLFPHCHGRQYGDSRNRGPFKENWQHDLSRVKRDIADYRVIGEINLQALRQFHGSHSSPVKPFNPVPDGFDIDFGRKVLPAGDTE